MRIRWLRKALQNLEIIAQYIRQDNPEIALRVVKKIPTGVNQLTEFPLMGRKGRVETTRELIIVNIPYIIVYNEIT